MARIFKVTLELHAPSASRPNYCVETFETVRTAPPIRVLHFGIAHPPTEKDLEWLREVIGAEMESLIHRTIGLQTALQF